MIKKKVKIEKPVVLSENQPGEIKLKKTKIKVVGIGEGGSSIVSEIALRVKKAAFVVANTNEQALKTAGRNVLKLQFGESLTHGLGTGMNSEIGEAAALAEKDKIKKIFDGQNLCIIVACLGGGAGSGASPVFAKIARSTGCLTYGIFTLPFNFEGEKKMAIARKALEQLKPKLHAFSVIPNERIFQIIGKETPLKKALSAINEKLAAGLEGLIEIIYEPGLINIDFADLKTVLEGQGRLTYLNTVDVPKKEGIIQEAIEKMLNSPLYPYGIRGARGVLYNIAGGKNLALSDVNQISKTISELANKDAKIIFGVSQNQKYEGKIKTTLLATGCGTKFFVNEKMVKEEQLPEIKENEIKNEPAIKIISVKPSVKKDLTKAKQKIQKKPKNKTKKKKQTASSNARNKNRKKIKKIRTTPGKKIEKKIKAKIIVEKTESRDKSAGQARIRKNALQLKTEVDQEEAGMVEREKVWETPAFLRKKKIV
jgi:cell division protein FtsZ